MLTELHKTHDSLPWVRVHDNLKLLIDQAEHLVDLFVKDCFELFTASCQQAWRDESRNIVSRRHDQFAILDVGFRKVGAVGEAGYLHEELWNVL